MKLVTQIEIEPLQIQEALVLKLKKKKKRKKELTCINNLPEISITKTIKKELKNLKVKHPFK